MLSVSTQIKAAQLAAMLPSLNGGAIGVYSSPRPATADSAATGTLLGWISNAGFPWTPGSLGAGLRYVQDGPFLLNDPTLPWVFSPISAGTAKWFRLYGNSSAENFLTRYDMTRIDGDIAQLGTGSNAELQLPTVAIALGAAFPVTQFVYTIPPIYS